MVLGHPPSADADALAGSRESSRDATNPRPQVVVILGMHRSGTSCLTQMLALCGLHLGDSVPSTEVSAGASNLGGCFEAREAVEINDQILAASGGAWHRPPGELRCRSETDHRMRTFVAAMETAGVAGWKDPRTLLTFPLWRPLLANYRIVACLRRPLAVARSLEVRDGLPLEQGLDLWLAYNERLRDVADQEPRILWFDFDQPTAWMHDWLQRSCHELGLRYSDAALESFVDVERHHEHTDLPDGRCRALYQDLWYRAHVAEVRQASARPLPPAEAARQPGAASLGKLADHDRQLSELAQVLVKHNAVAQRQQRELEALYAKTQVDYLQPITALCQDLTATVDERLAGLREQLARLDTMSVQLANHERMTAIKFDALVARFAADSRRLQEALSATLETAQRAQLEAVYQALDHRSLRQRIRRFVDRQRQRIRRDPA